jgi:hypothetical protein
MKPFFLLAIATFFVSASFSQNAASGKIDSLVDAWNITTWYVGELKNGKPNGLGVAVYKSGTAIRYVGNFSNGKYEGVGTLLFKDGAFLSGEWKAGKLNGQGANLTTDKVFYQGDFVNGEKNGNGTLVYGNNSFYQGSYKNDKQEGRIVSVGADATIFNDNIYVAGKMNGQGYQYEVSSKKLFEGTWKDDKWVSAATGNYTSFLKSSSFIGEKTDKQVLMGIIKEKKPVDTTFYYNYAAKKRYYGPYRNGVFDKGLIIRDDSTRFLGAVNDDGAYGTCAFIKLGKFYNYGNYEKDFMSGDRNLSISIANKTVFYGQVSNKGNWNGQAWYANNSNEIYKGKYVDNSLTEGWRIDKVGYFVKATWNKGNIATVSALYNEKGEPINIKPKTFSDALSTVARAYPTGYFGISGNDDFSDGYEEFLDEYYQSLINFPGTSSYDIIGVSKNDYDHYVSTFATTSDFAEAKKKYDYLCTEIKKAGIVLKKGAVPVKLSGDIKAADADNDFNISQFTLTPAAKGYNYFGVSVVIRKNIDNDYAVMVICGDKEDALTLKEEE